LLDDAEHLRALAANLEGTIARLAATDDASPDPERRARELVEANATSHEQLQVADRLLRRLAEPVDGDCGRPSLVLIVDDSLEAREATALVLEQAGFRVVTATNGVEALIVAHYARPVVALLDLMMPVLDGLQTARLLSESPSTRQMKVVAYSGRTDMFQRRLPGTFTAILAKPTTSDALLTVVQQQADLFGRDIRDRERLS
jgi:CheY-like chemotaxis protein